VTYAKQNAEKHDDVAGPGNGYVDVFNTDGKLLRRFHSLGPLDSPWGIVRAPDDFGRFSHDVLIGNFGDGHINAFDAKTGHFEGELRDAKGQPITIAGLWGLKFGNNGSAGKSNTLFFTAGIGDEKHGLFGSLQARKEEDNDDEDTHSDAGRCDHHEEMARSGNTPTNHAKAGDKASHDSDATKTVGADETGMNESHGRMGHGGASHLSKGGTAAIDDFFALGLGL
jgi:hypothetical protein